jgi:hypothetical protein
MAFLAKFAESVCIQALLSSYGERDSESSHSKSHTTHTDNRQAPQSLLQRNAALQAVAAISKTSRLDLI